MRILFSVFTEDIVEEKREKVFEKLVETNSPLSQLDPLSDINDGYQSTLFVGKSLVFWDISCFLNQEQAIIQRIKDIQSEVCLNRGGIKEPHSLSIYTFNQGNMDEAFMPDPKNSYFVEISRFELGASGLGEIIAIINNPILSSILGSVIFTSISFFFKWARNKISRRAASNDTTSRPTVVVLNIKKLKKGFSRITGIDKQDYELTRFEKKKNGKYHIEIRTIDNLSYAVVAYPSGRIESFQQIVE